MKYIDVKNSLGKHLCIGLFSIGLAVLLNYIFEIGWSTSFARVSFFLLFFTLTIGPVMRLRKSKKEFSVFKKPWTWRGELGIWFVITGLVHFYFAMNHNFIGGTLKGALGGGIGGGGLGLANLLGLIALVLSLVLAATSFNKVIKFLGIESWKWIQSFTYVVFYLVMGHLIYFQFFTTHGSGPDWFGYASVVMFLIILILQISACVKTVKEYRRENSKK
jgi:methionine sulfoxide reductase heme-binding subunit